MGMKNNMAALLGIAFVVAILATGLFYGLVVVQFDQPGEASEVMVVVAARDMASGELLRIEDVKLAPPGPGQGLIEGFSSPRQVEGLTVLAEVAAGEPIARGTLAGRGSAGGAALGVPPGLRAISVHVADSTGVVSLLQAGNRVDAQVVLDQGERRGENTVLKTVLQNLQVLSVEEATEAAANGERLPVVTLLTLPEEADILGVADAAAQIRLLLRHPLDDEVTSRDRVSLAGAVARPPETPRPSSALSRTAAPAPSTDSSQRPVESAEARAIRP